MDTLQRSVDAIQAYAAREQRERTTGSAKGALTRRIAALVEELGAAQAQQGAQDVEVEIPTDTTTTPPGRDEDASVPYRIKLSDLEQQITGASRTASAPEPPPPSGTASDDGSWTATGTAAPPWTGSRSTTPTATTRTTR